MAESTQLWPSLLISLWLIAGLIRPSTMGYAVSYGLLSLQLWLSSHMWGKKKDPFSSHPLNIFTKRRGRSAGKVFSNVANVFNEVSCVPGYLNSVGDACSLKQKYWSLSLSYLLLNLSSNTQPSKQSLDIPAMVSFYRPSPSTCHMTFILQGKHLRVNCSKGMLADETKRFILEDGQCSRSTAEKGERTV